MLTDATEIEIASRARQPGIRDPNRSRKPLERFFADFAANAELAGASLLDLGPGQWDFGVIARSHGASRIVGVDNDEAVLELGRYKGFEAVAFNIRDVTRDAIGTFDGVYNRGSLNAFWGATGDDHAMLVDRLSELARDGGWTWFAPWNGPATTIALEEEQIRDRLKVQVAAFARNGFACYEPDNSVARRWAASGDVVNTPIFVRNLAVPETLAPFRTA